MEIWQKYCCLQQILNNKSFRIKIILNFAFIVFTRTLGLDLVVRDPEGNVIDPDSTGAIQLYRRVSGHLPSQGLSKNLGVQCFWNEFYFFLVIFLHHNTYNVTLLQYIINRSLTGVRVRQYQ